MTHTEPPAEMRPSCLGDHRPPRRRAWPAVICAAAFLLGTFAAVVGLAALIAGL